MKHFVTSDGLLLRQNGRKMAKKRNPVYLNKQLEEFSVQTREGILTGKPGDFVAHDPISGDIWPIAASYVEQHYEDF